LKEQPVDVLQLKNLIHTLDLETLETLHNDEQE